MKFPTHLDAATRKRIRAELRGISQLIQLMRDHPKPAKAPAQLKPRSTNGSEPVTQLPDPSQNKQPLPCKKRPAPQQEGPAFPVLVPAVPILALRGIPEHRGRFGPERRNLSPRLWWPFLGQRHWQKNGCSRHQFSEQRVGWQLLPAVAIGHLVEEDQFLAGRALRQVVHQHFLAAVGMQRLREQRVGAHVHVVELIQRVHLRGRVLGRADSIGQ